MKLNKVILSLGSNRNQEMNIRMAGELIRQYFVSTFFSEAVYTEPIGLPAEAPFLNQVVIAFTSERPETLYAALKQMELQLGRTREEKAHHIIRIDIDLLQWNEQVLKPDDLKREYVSSLLLSLRSTH